jgi:glyoxylase-like metal-dependent hydrolase (beta-lactamase superfamily II)
MRVERITDSLTRLERAHFVNAYLVQDEGGCTLVDTMIGGSAPGVIEAARSAGGEIGRIALTHGHGDHVGSLDALKERLGADVEVLMPELDARIHAGEKVVEGKVPGGWPAIKTVPDVRLKPGDRVGSLEVIATPGHTPGHVSFLDTRDRTVIAGDAVTTFGQVAVPTWYYWRFPLAAFATWDKQKALASARDLRALEPAMLVAGHGPPVPTPVPALDAAIARAER